MPKRAKELMQQISVRMPKSMMDEARKIVGGAITPTNTQLVEYALRKLIDDARDSKPPRPPRVR